MNDATADPVMEMAVKYAAVCDEVLAAANACLEVANPAVAARREIAKCQNGPQLPGTPIAIRNFTRMAEQKEEEFAPLYTGFAETCTKARNMAAQLLIGGTEHDAEMVLMFNFEEDVLDRVATTKAVLRANHGPTPAGFIQGVQEANELMENPGPEEGNIYTPAPPTKRTCPWCAETIKAAAVVCRFCGRDVEPVPGAARPS